jgi:hypothetical protein
MGREIEGREINMPLEHTCMWELREIEDREIYI